MRRQITSIRCNTTLKSPFFALLIFSSISVICSSMQSTKSVLASKSSGENFSFNQAQKRNINTFRNVPYTYLFHIISFLYTTTLNVVLKKVKRQAPVMYLRFSPVYHTVSVYVNFQEGYQEGLELKYASTGMCLTIHFKL